MRNKMIKIISLAMSVIMTLSMALVSASAYSYTESGATSLSPSNSDFSSARTPKYNQTRVTIPDSVSGRYSTDLFHYEAPVKGYYKIYTTGSTDTMGKVFEHNNFLWWNSYDMKGSDDDSGIGDNFKIITYFDKREDYYIGVRGYSNRVGSYTLKIEPNDDLVYSRIGGLWLKTHNVEENDRIAKLYLNKDQVAHLYQMLRDQATMAALQQAYTRNGPLGAFQRLASSGNTLYTIVADAIGIVDDIRDVGNTIDPVVGGLISIGASALVNLFDICYNYADVNQLGYLMGNLQNFGGANYVRNPATGNDDYFATSGVCINIDRTIIYVYSLILGGYVPCPNYHYVFTSYNSQALVGTSYERGEWN